jgi:hypothetical protein
MPERAPKFFERSRVLAHTDHETPNLLVERFVKANKDYSTPEPKEVAHALFDDSEDGTDEPSKESWDLIWFFGRIVAVGGCSLLGLFLSIGYLGHQAATFGLVGLLGGNVFVILAALGFAYAFYWALSGK